MSSRKATISIGTVPQLIATEAARRIQLVINNVGTVQVQIGSEQDITVASSFPLATGDKLETDSPDSLWAFVAAGIGTLGIWDDCG